MSLSLGGLPGSSPGGSNKDNSGSTMKIAYSGLSNAGGDYGDLGKLSDNQLRDVLEFGANAATKDDRARIAREARAELNARAPVYSAPTSNGMSASGMQAGMVKVREAQKAPVATPKAPNPVPVPETADPAAASSAPVSRPIILAMPQTDYQDRDPSLLELALLTRNQGAAVQAPQTVLKTTPGASGGDSLPVLALLGYGLTLL